MNQKEIAEQKDFRKRRVVLVFLFLLWLVFGLPASVFIAAGLCYQWRPVESVPYYRRTARQRDLRCLTLILGLLLYPLIIVFSFISISLALVHQMIPRRA